MARKTKARKATAPDVTGAFRQAPNWPLLALSLIGVAPLVLVAPAGAPEGRAFLEAAAQAGSRWSYGSPGVGTVGHLGMELLKSRSALRPEHIPYPGYPQVFNAIQGGDLQLSMLPPALAMAQVQAARPIGHPPFVASPEITDIVGIAINNALAGRDIKTELDAAARKMAEVLERTEPKR